MKKISTGAFFIILGLFVCGYVSAQDIETESKINQVTVYPDSALLTRVASLKAAAGRHKVIFPEIIPEIDENSLRVSFSADAQVKILGTFVKKEFLKEEPGERLRQLQEEIQKLQDEERRLEDSKKILSEEKQFLDSVRLFSAKQLPKELVTRMPQPKELEDILSFLDAKLKDNFSQVADAELKIRDLWKKIDVLNKQISQLTGPSKKLKRLIEVELEVSEEVAVDLSVSYLVKGASWQPIYDARASFDKSEVELISYGIIKQTTGEDWDDAEIYLSTAKPAIGGRMPYVSPVFLRPYQKLPQERIARKMYQGAAFDKAEILEEKEASEPQVVYSKPEEKGIAVVYKLSHKAFVKSDGSEHKLPVSSQKLSAEFAYSVYPRTALNAYLGSRVTNAKDLQLLSGRVNIFLERDFVGTSGIDNIGPGEEFDLYLGADENVKIKREQIEKKVDETLIAGIPSPLKRTMLKYKLTVENYKSKNINVNLFEAIPVAEDDRIKVKINQVSLEPKEKDWKDRKGVWLWEIGLEPRAKKEITYSYTVEHPREMQVEGL